MFGLLSFVTIVVVCHRKVDHFVLSSLATLLMRLHEQPFSIFSFQSQSKPQNITSNQQMFYLATVVTVTLLTPNKALMAPSMPLSVKQCVQTVFIWVLSIPSLPW